MKCYCVKCKRKTETVDMELFSLKNNSQMLKGICLNCGSKKSTFIKKENINEIYY